jgi:two-component system chemotaxis response regulator CheB
MKKKRVLIIDDSAIVRDILGRELPRQPDIEVVAAAMDPYIARDKLARFPVDVVLLDIEMPRMDGLTFLRYLMKSHPLPVIVLSSLVDGANQASLEALELGAIDVVAKPSGPYSVVEVLAQLVERIRSIDLVDFEKVKSQALQRQMLAGTAAQPRGKILTRIRTTNSLIAVGASTGGTQALEALFRAYDRIMPPTLAVIHMPEKFTASYARRLNEICSPTIKEAENGEIALPGCVYVAPGNFHMTVKPFGAEYKLIMHSSPKLHGQRPAVDPLFDSVAESVGGNGVGILLTGMGRDGAAGLLRMRQAGAHTICQDEASCVVFGMPKEAIALGAADKVLPLDEIYGQLKAHMDTREPGMSQRHE